MNFDRPGNGHFAEPSFNMLGEFIRLADPAVGDGAILSFARSWGLLDLCSHGLPRTHDPHSIPRSLSFGLWLAGDWRCSDGIGSPERLDWWRYWAGQAGALVAILDALRSNALGSDRDWHVLSLPGPWVEGDLWERMFGIVDEATADMRARALRGIRRQDDLTANALDTWLRLAALRPHVRWRSQGPDIELRNAGLFDTIGLLLVFLGGDLEGFALCHGCRVAFEPHRKLGPRDRAHYCPACRVEKRSRREASRAYYRRKSADPAFRASEAARQSEVRARARQRTARDLEVQDQG